MYSTTSSCAFETYTIAGSSQKKGNLEGLIIDVRDVCSK